MSVLVPAMTFRVSFALTRQGGRVLRACGASRARAIRRWSRGGRVADDRRARVRVGAGYGLVGGVGALNQASTRA